MNDKLKSQKLFVAGSIVVILAVVILLLSLYFNKSGTDRVLILGKDTSSITTYTLETVTTADQQSQGLSDRSSLGAQSGMLFSYDQTAERCMWMKDMRFNIDIIWLDDHQKITQIEANLSPSSYPKVFCANGRYVIELPSGSAAKHQLKVGQSVNL
ncbi:MAG TPA: DUF192 domain-containing protein [Candidatus Saccharimonadales bacterium]|jgi:hypothetical protein